MITSEQIEEAKRSAPLGSNPLFGDEDNIRIAYEWLDAQRKTRLPVDRGRPMKHIVEAWAGCYVSQADVEVAAFLHADVKGSYPRFNISMRLVEPHPSRLAGFKHANLNALSRQGKDFLERTLAAKEEQ